MLGGPMHVVRMSAVALVFLPIPIAGQSHGDFEYKERVDAITHEDRSYVYTLSHGDSAFLKGEARWRCRGADVQLMLLAGDALERWPVRVQWRVDDESATEPAFWALSTEETAVLADRLTTLAITDRASLGTRLRVRLHDSRGIQYDLEFNVRGLSGALGLLTCSLDGIRAQAEATQRRETEIERLRSQNPVVGRRGSDLWTYTKLDCWKAFVRDVEMNGEFFPSVEAARAAGYTRQSADCR